MRNFRTNTSSIFFERIIRTVLFIPIFFTVLVLRSQTTALSDTINIYTPVLHIDTSFCPAKITVADTSGFLAGDSVLIIQMQGADIDTANTPAFGTINHLNGAGNFEIGKITQILSDTMLLNGKLRNSYSITGKVQLVRIPHYINANVTGSLTCRSWNGQTGGVLIFSVQKNLQLNANIDVSGKGFRGGTVSNNLNGICGSSFSYFYPLTPGASTVLVGGAQKGEGIAYVNVDKQAGRGPLASGGGGGNKHNTGGGGGSNYTGGGKGGNELEGCPVNQTGGLGGYGLSTFYANGKVFAGGGGGCGDINDGVGSAGANGGGIVIITAGSLTGNNYAVNANGSVVTAISTGFSDGSGGGGAGGTIFLKTGTVQSPVVLQANGGKGGDNNANYCAGPGGGGGAGSILTSLASLANISYNLAPGASGTILNPALTCANSSYGASSGSVNVSGILTGRKLPYIQSTETISLNVADSIMICSGNSVTLTASGASSYKWNTSSTATSIVVSPNITTSYTVSSTNTLTCFQATKTLTVHVSKCTSLNERDKMFLVFSIYPNPGSEILNIESNRDIKFVMYNALGDCVLSGNYLKGKHQIAAELLPDGIYFVRVISGEAVQSTTIIKRK